MLRAVTDHCADSLFICTTSEAHVLAFDSCSISNKTVDVSSTARRKRNHAFSGTWRTVSGAISLRSSAINPKPPPCIKRSAARKDWSSPRQRTHNNCCSSTPAASALRGSNESRASINAHTSSCAVLEAKAESSTVVRPEQGGPQISVSAPRGKPPASASISGIPVRTVSTLLRSR